MTNYLRNFAISISTFCLMTISISAAKADVATQLSTVPFSNLDWKSPWTGKAIYLRQFDSQLGKLTKAELKVLIFTGLFSFRTESGDRFPSTVTVNEGLNIYVRAGDGNQRPVGPSLTSAGFSRTFSKQLSGFDGYYDNNGTSGLTDNYFFNVASETPASFSDSGTLHAFTGTNNLEYILETDSLVQAKTSGVGSMGSSAHGSAVIVLEYTYEPKASKESDEDKKEKDKKACEKELKSKS